MTNDARSRAAPALERDRLDGEAVLDAISAPVFIKDESHRVIYCNRPFCEFVGRPHEEVVGHFEWTIFPERTEEDCRKADEAALKTGHETELEETIRDFRGDRRTVLSKRTVTRSDGKIRVVCSMSDVTELMRLQEIALQNEKHLRTFIEQLPVSVAMFDYRLRCLGASHAWIVQHHLGDRDVVGGELRDVMPATPANWKVAHRRALMGQVIRHDEDQATGPDGEMRWLNWEVRPWSQGGHIGGFVVLTESISEKRRMREELEHTRSRQVEASRLVSIGQMAAGVAHEINNPLTVIMGKAWMIDEKLANGLPLTPEQIRDAMAKITEYATRIGRIVKALRAFSRDPSSDPMTVAPIQDVFSDTMSMCAERFRNHGVKLTVDPIPAEAVRCRPMQISQILVNLLNNAFDSARVAGNSPEVRIEFASGEQGLEIRVTDSGPGVPEGLEERIFEPFFTTKEVGKGTGLGLSISNSLAKDHGGTLRLDLARSRSCFLLRLPRVSMAEKGIA